MCDFLKYIDEKQNQTIDYYFFQSKQTQKYWHRDNDSALKIQSKFKMYIKRKQYLNIKQAAIKIQTALRAFFARKKFGQIKEKQVNKKNLIYFSRQATMIQKVFRGYHLRKYQHNYYVRKNQLQKLAKLNQYFKKQFDQVAQEQRILDYQKRQKLARAQFNQLAKNLHHLTSTKLIPGVYNSPFFQNKPLAFGEQVEQHLRKAFKLNYKWKPPNKETILKYSMKNTTIKGTTKS